MEWGLLGAVILVLLLVFLQQAQRVQGQAERAAIQSVLGALRTAAVLQDLQRRAAGAPDTAPQRVPDPFELLQQPPSNYRGRLDTAQAMATAPGSWFFDPACGCIGYVPREPRWLERPSGAALLRFRVLQPGGPLQLKALESYVWQGVALD